MKSDNECKSIIMENKTKKNEKWKSNWNKQPKMKIKIIKKKEKTTKQQVRLVFYL